MAQAKLPLGTAPFLFWLKLGDDRSFKAVAAHYDVNPSAVTRRAARERWIERLHRDVEPRVEAQALDRGLDAVVTSLADFRIKQAEVGAALVTKGMEALEVLQPNTVKEALDAIRLGSELQGRAYEMPKSRIEVSVEHTLKERFERFVQANPEPRRIAPQVTIDFGELEDGLTEDEIAEAQEVSDDE